MKEFIRKIYDTLVAIVAKVPTDKLLHFIAGLIIAAFCVITLKWGAWSILPVAIIGAAKEAFDHYTGGKWDWWDLAATVIGGLVILLFWLI